MSANTCVIERLGDAALLLRFGDGIDASLNARVHRVARHLAAVRPAWLQDIVPAYATLGIFVDTDAIAIDRLRDAAEADPLCIAEHWLHAALANATSDADEAPARVVEIPVRYGGDDGPDLQALAQHARMSPDEVVHRHSGTEYIVAMLGFAPGFPYLLGLDPALAMPRLATPRERVPAGSVAIGGAQTGLYPQAGPGGWRLIGRTDTTLFDPQRTPPTALQPGDRVRFIPQSQP